MSFDPANVNKKSIVFFGADGAAPKYDSVTGLYYDSSKLFAPGLIIPDDGYIGSDSAQTAIQIDAAGHVTLSAGLTVNGDTTTVSTTNTVVSDTIIELNNGATSNANDSGFIIERGSTGDNAAFVWDESEDKFTLGTTTATGSSTGDLSITKGILVADLEGDVTGSLIVDEAAVDVGADSIFFRDADDSDSSKRDTIADFITAVAGTTANTSLSASAGVLTVEIDGTTITRNGSGELVAVPSAKTIESVSVNTTVSKDVTLVTTGSSAIAITLPASPSDGSVVAVKKIDNGTGTVVISGNSGHTVDGGTHTLYYDDESVSMVFQTDTWYKI